MRDRCKLLDAEALQERDEQSRERFFLDLDFGLPAGIGVDSGAGLIVIVAFAELEIPAVGEAQILSAGGDDRIIARQVEAARGRAVHREGVVEHVSVAGRFGCVLQPLCKAAKLFRLVAVVGAQILPPLGLFDGVRQTMSTVKAHGFG